jgi:flagellar basal body-associated protein FliL
LARKNFDLSRETDGKRLRKNRREREKKKNLLRTTLGVFFLVGWMGWEADSGPIQAKVSAQERKIEEARSKGNDPGPMVRLKPLIVNLKDEGAVRYVKTSIVLEISREAYVSEVNALIPSILDRMISILGDKKLADLRTPQFREDLKRELLGELHRISGSPKIKNIYFDEFIFQ